MSDAIVLDEGERVLWKGQPDLIGYARHTGSLWMLASGVVLLLVMVITVTAIWNPAILPSRAPEPHTDFFSMPPISSNRVVDVPSAREPLFDWQMLVLAGFGFFLVLVLLVQPLRRLRLVRHMRYILTDQRAIIETGRTGAHRRTFPLQHLPFVEYRPGPSGRGDVLFAEQVQTWGNMRYRDGFVAIADAKAVERVLVRAATGAGGALA